MIAIVAIIIFLILIFMGMNIGLAMLLVGFVGYAYMLNFQAALTVVRTVPIDTASKYSYIVIPLFILMGNFAFHAGLSDALYDAASKWLSRLPGALACATIAACACFGAICGSTAATAATMGAIAMPEMRKHGYNDALSTGSLAVGGTLGILIPPSTPMIIYAIIAECSIGQLFSAGIVPGVVLACLYIIFIVIRCKIHPDWAPAPTSTPWRVRLASLKGLIGVVVLFGVTLGGMFAGLFSVNQASAIGAFLAFLLMLWADRGFNVKNFVAAMKDTVTTFAMTFLIVIGAAVFCKFLAVTQMPMRLADAISSMNVSPYLVLVLITIIYIFLGAIMDELPMIMLTVPIFLPIMTELGFDPIWFGIYIVMVMEMGAICPPVGLNCFIISGIAKNVPLVKIYKGILPFMVTIIIAVVIVTAFPEIVLFLPNLFYG